MNHARTKLLITLGKIVIFYLSIAPWSRTKFYKLRVQKEKLVVFASHPHTPGNREYNTARPARHIA